jgi:hypothetical protein
VGSARYRKMLVLKGGGLDDPLKALFTTDGLLVLVTDEHRIRLKPKASRALAAYINAYHGDCP